MGTSILPNTGEAGFYSWKDENGKIHFTDDLSNIPPEYRDKNQGLKKHRGLTNPSSSESSEEDASSQESSFTEPGLEIYEVPLTLLQGGNYLVKTMLNGKVEATLMLDTGASMVTISEELGKKLGWRRRYDTPEIPFSTAGGTVWNPILALDTVEANGAKVVEVEASINDGIEGIDGLLGMSFLGDFKVVVDRTQSKMFLKPLNEPGDRVWGGKPGSWWKAKFTNYNDQIVELEKQATLLTLARHPKSSKFREVIDFYTELRRKLNRRAVRAGVPRKFRPQS